MSAFSPLADTPTLGGFAPLRYAERVLVQACLSGDIAKIGLRQPAAASRDVSVRASFLAFVLGGGVPLRGRRLHVVGAFIEGRLDLGGVAVAGSLWFYRCRFDAPVLLDGAHIAGALSFGGCHLPGLLAEGCRIDGDLALNAACTIEHELRLRRAHIGGDLECARLDLSGGSNGVAARRAMQADALRVGGDVRLSEGFDALGEVRFCGARIEGDVHCSGRFNGNAVDERRRDTALRLDRIEIGGTLRFDTGFGSAGGVSLQRARIGGDLDASGASFDRLGDGAWEDGASLRLDRARIEGALVLRDLQEPLLGASFVGTRAGSLVDDATTWGERLALDGFAYRRFGDGAPLDVGFRVDWLERQKQAHLKTEFRMQPWQRAIRVLRRMGHDRRASSLAVRREGWLRRCGRIGEWAPPGLRWLPRAAHALLGLLAGYGYRPGRLVAWMLAVWGLSALVYWAAAAPAAQAVSGSFVFSLDRLLPLLKLHPTGAWPAGADWVDTVRWWSRIEAGFGWVALFLFVVSIAGWIDRDRRR
jgi:hypothetical protein